MQLEEHCGRLHLCMTVQRLGCDYTVALFGGEAHVGAVALGVPYISPEGTVRASVSVLTVLGHREDALACEVAGRFSAVLHARACVVCGIHFAGLRAEERAQVLALTDTLTQRALAALMA